MSAKISAAIETKSVIGSTQPNLLVLDEIDGAMGGDNGESGGSGAGNAIGYLVDLIKQNQLYYRNKMSEDQDKDSGSSSKRKDDDDDDDDDDFTEKAPTVSSKKKANKGKPILRPIICICNDHLAPCLRPLLPHVKLFLVDTIATTALSDRLAHVCRQERVRADKKTLIGLCDVVEGDVRAALHTIHFLQAYQRSNPGAHGQGGLSLEEITRMALGEKDSVKGNMELFQKVLTKKAVTSQTDHIQASSSLLARRQNQPFFESFPRVYSDASVVEKVLNACQHNYLSLCSNDFDMFKLNALSDWLCCYDVFSSSRAGGDLMAFTSYLPYSIVAVHHIAASERRPVIELPKLAQNHRQQQVRNMDVLRSFISSSPYLLKSRVSMRECVGYFLSYFLDMLAPHLHSHAYHLLPPADLVIMRKLIHLLVDTNTTFLSQAVVQSGYVNWNKGQHQTQWVLSPGVDALTQFNYSMELSDYGVYLFSKHNPFSYVHHSNHSHQAVPVLVDGPMKRRFINENIKENVAREVEYEHVRRLETYVGAATAKTQHVSSTTEAHRVMKDLIDITETATTEEGAAAPTTIEKPELASSKIKIPGLRGFMIAKTKPTSSSSETTSSSIAPLRANVHATRAMLPLHFLFMEGFSNAVKRPVPIDKFL